MNVTDKRNTGASSMRDGEAEELDSGGETILLEKICVQEEGAIRDLEKSGCSDNDVDSESYQVEQGGSWVANLEENSRVA